MNLVTHITFGMLLTLLIFNLYNPQLSQQTINLYLIAAAVGSLLPDVDHPKAYVSRRHWMAHGASHLLEAVAHHRGLTHSLLALVLLSGITIAGLNYLHADVQLALPFALGYLSHLLIDSLNPTGVKWLQPFSQRTLKLDKKIWLIRIRITTGSITERLIGATIGLLFIYLYLNKYNKGFLL